MKKLLLVLELFDINFLILILIQSLTLIIYDYNFFKDNKKFSAAKKSRYFGYTGIIIAILLFLTRKIVLSR